MDQIGSSSGVSGAGGTGDGRSDEAAACSRFVFAAEPEVAGPEAGEAGMAQGRVTAGTDPGAVADGISGVEARKGPGAADRDSFPDGFSGSLVLQNVESLTEEQAGTVLARLDHAARWVQAQQARVLARLQTVYEDDALAVTGVRDWEMAFSLAAEEAATILGVPSGTGKALMSRAGDLCTKNTATLKVLEAGQISYGHAETVVDQCVGVIPEELPGFEAELLGLAVGQTRAQFRVKAQRLRENLYPQTIVERQRTAFDQRRVYVQPEPDGMSWLSALLPAPAAQAIFTQLSVAARGEQAAGDTRTVDQLRTDILTDLLGGHEHECGEACTTGRGGRGRGKGEDKGKSGRGRGKNGSGRDTGKGSGSGKHSGSGSGPDSGSGKGPGSGSGSCRIRHGAKARTEILVVINAETLFGADDRAAELVGYGPISPETARRMARKAMKWTPVERDPKTDQILRVGNQRKVSVDLKRFLRVRDGTCRFPGCRMNAVISEIDHTKPWAQGGPTAHDNLEHLCRRHHLFKTEGFWKARQPSPGVIEWTSPGGRTYRTEPGLTLAPDRAPDTNADDGTDRDDAGKANPVQVRRNIGPVPMSDAEPGDRNDYGDNPPPF